MSNESVVRSWRDPEFRKQLAAEGGAPAHPSGEVLAEDWSTGFDPEVGFTAAITCGGTSKSAARCCC
jgi:mersacidin/lichenicidin family type 2 lantibiotic